MSVKYDIKLGYLPNNEPLRLLTNKIHSTKAKILIFALIWACGVHILVLNIDDASP